MGKKFIIEKIPATVVIELISGEESWKIGDTLAQPHTTPTSQQLIRLASGYELPYENFKHLSVSQMPAGSQLVEKRIIIE